jgi:hypothetical protein
MVAEPEVCLDRPGETLLMRMPCGPSSCESALATFSSAALPAP